VEEVLNDTWLKAWSTIPPKSPAYLKLYLARITRNLSYDKFRGQSREKRGGGVITVALEELAECIPAKGQPGDALDARELRDGMNRFLGTLPERDRQVFLRRYFHVEATKVIARAMGVRETGVRTILSRTRKKLKRYLEKEDLYYE
jgi:RNA polymerase sigma-70 factor (ECF subfamily)